MKKICSALAVLLPGLGLAQDDTPAIKVTTTLHDDGSRTVIKLDAGQHTSDSTTYTAGDKVQQRIVYVLDEENQPVSGKVYAANGAVVFTSVYQHDGQNRITEEADYTPAGQLMRRFVYEFGSTGKVSRIRAFDAQGNELRASNATPDVKKALPRRHR